MTRTVATQLAPMPHFICDEMLKHLARWLRAAGYDTLAHDDGASDRVTPDHVTRRPRRDKFYWAGGRLRRARLESWMQASPGDNIEKDEL